MKDAIGTVVTGLGDFPLDPDSGDAWLWSADGKQLLWSSKEQLGSALLSPDRFKALATDLAHPQPDQLPVRVQQITLQNGASPQSYTCLSRAVPLRTGNYGMLAVAIGAATRSMTQEPTVKPAVIVKTQAEQSVAPLSPQPEDKTPLRRAFRIGSSETKSSNEAAEIADRRETRMRDLRQGLQHDFARLSTKPTEAKPTEVLPNEVKVPVDPPLAEIQKEQPPDQQIVPISNSAATLEWQNRWLAEENSKRHPLRFVWQTDAEGRFVHLSRELTDAVGPKHALIMGQSMSQAAARLNILETDDIQRSMLTRDTWAAKAALWPVENSDLAIPVEMAGMPVIEQGQFAGFRGYGIARVERAVQLPNNVAQALEADHPLEQDESLNRFGPAVAGSAIPVRNELSNIPEIPKAKQTNPLPLLPEAPLKAPPIPAAPVTPTIQRAELAKPPEPAKDSLSTSEREAFREIARALEKNELEKNELEKNGLIEKSKAKKPHLPEQKPPQPVETIKAGSLQALKKDLVKRSKLRLGARTIDEPELPIPAKAMAPVIPYDQARREQQSRTDQQLPWANVIDRLPLGLLVTQNGEAVYANRHLLELAEHVDFEQFKNQIGISGLFASNENRIQENHVQDKFGENPDKLGENPDASEMEKSRFTLMTRSGKTVRVDAHIQTTTWNGAPATLTSIKRISVVTAPQLRSLELDLLTTKSELRELQSVLDTATDGIILIDPEGRILSMNRSAEALFGFDQNELTGEPMTVLFEPESHIAALDYLEGLRSNGVRSIMNDGRDVKGRERNGGVIPLFMTIARIGDSPGSARFCIVLRDITHWKKVEADLLDAKRAAEDSSTNKTDFLATISHEIRTPLNAIIGFSQVMMTESFGPIGNERYKQYAKDINASGEHVISLVNDLLDLSKVASGKLDLTFASVDMNAVVAGCVAMIQPQANAGKVIVRSQLASHLPLVVADERATRQIVINLLSNAAKFTEAGGQVIASTSFTDQGEVVIRVRDTGVGMSEDDIKRAMEPFRQIPGPRSGGGTGLGLPLTKALVEANRAAFSIQSAPHQGTLVEVTFPSTRVLAE